MGFSLKDIEDVGEGFLTGGAVGGGSLSGGLGALERGDNPLSAAKTGLGLDALGLAIGSGVAASGIANAPGVVGAPSVSGATPVVATDAAPVTTSQALETNLINGGAAAPAASAAPAAAPVAPSAVAPAVDDSVGMAFTPGTGSVGAMDPSNVGVVGSVANAIEAHPIASLIGANMAGGMLQGIGNREAQMAAIEKQKQAQEDIATMPQRLKEGNSSVGGKGVNLNLRPGSKVLRRSDGTPVYRPGTGIINQGMNGVRG